MKGLKKDNKRERLHGWQYLFPEENWYVPEDESQLLNNLTGEDLILRY